MRLTRLWATYSGREEVGSWQLAEVGKKATQFFLRNVFIMSLWTLQSPGRARPFFLLFWDDSNPCDIIYHRTLTVLTLFKYFALWNKGHLFCLKCASSSFSSPSSSSSLFSSSSSSSVYGKWHKNACTEIVSIFSADCGKKWENLLMIKPEAIMHLCSGGF